MTLSSYLRKTNALFLFVAVTCIPALEAIAEQSIDTSITFPKLTGTIVNTTGNPLQRTEDYSIVMTALHRGPYIKAAKININADLSFEIPEFTYQPNEGWENLDDDKEIFFALAPYPEGISSADQNENYNFSTTVAVDLSNSNWRNKVIEQYKDLFSSIHVYNFPETRIAKEDVNMYPDQSTRIKIFNWEHESIKSITRTRLENYESTNSEGEYIYVLPSFLIFTAEEIGNPQEIFTPRRIQLYLKDENNKRAVWYSRLAEIVLVQED